MHGVIFAKNAEYKELTHSECYPILYSTSKHHWFDSTNVGDIFSSLNACVSHTFYKKKTTKSALISTEILKIWTFTKHIANWKHEK